MSNANTSEFDPFAGPELAAVIPLTEDQKEIWKSSMKDDRASLCYNESMTVRLKGPVNIDKMARSIQQLIIRHESLRSTITPDGSYMSILAVAGSADIIHDTPEYGSGDWHALVANIMSTPFDLTHGPLFKAYIISHKNNDHSIILMAHHVICDGWSLDVLLFDLGQIYTAEITSREFPLKPAHRFSDYILYLESQSEAFNKSEQYWTDIFSADVPVLDLPVDFNRPSSKTYGANRITRTLDISLLEKMKTIAIASQSSLFAVLLTVWAVQISRLTNQKKIAIGVPFAGQPDAGMEDLVGHCVFLIPVLQVINEGISFMDHIKKTRSAILDAFEHQQLSFRSLIQKLHISPDTARSPLVSVSFTHTQKYSQDKIRFGDCEVEYNFNPRPAETFEIHLNAVESDNGIELLCHYNRSLFKAETIERHLDEFVSLLNDAVNHREKFPGDLKFFQ
jgi:hypothetical protein